MIRNSLPSSAVLTFWLAAVLHAESVQITVRDGQSGKTVPCRIHVVDEAEKPRIAPELPAWRDHFVCNGNTQFDLSPGKYQFQIERGPEWSAVAGSFVVDAGKPTSISAGLGRIATLSQDGWWSGDLHVHRSLDDIELLMEAEDLHVAPVITWWNNRNLWTDRTIPGARTVRFGTNRFYDVMAGEDEREGGALLFFHLPRPLAISGASRELPSPLRFVSDAREHADAWVDIEKPFWWDVPTWLAVARIDSIGLANNHMCRSQMFETEAWGRPRDSNRLPAPLGNGYWTQEIYYHMLNSGLRIPPSAGSASGVLPNPVGYNRVYAHVDGPMNYQTWWDALRAGRSFVTNGPLLLVRANGQLPGHVFPSSEVITVDVKLAGRDRIQTVQLIQNGAIEQAISGDAWSNGQRFNALKFQDSGWFLVRAIADNDKTFRFASTAPFYVEARPGARRVSRSSAQFFLHWVNERIERIQIDNPAQRREVVDYHFQARLFWDEKVKSATAE